MSYTPTTWVTGDTINATKLNKIEQGLVDANTIPVISVWYLEEWHIVGDFANCLAQLQANKPVLVIYYKNVSMSNGCVFGWYPEIASAVEYNTSYPNRITIWLASTEGLWWTANGVEFFD